MKRIVKGRRDGVTDDLADATPAQEAGQREQDRDDALSLLSGKHLMDIVGRTASVTTVQRIFFLI